MTTWPSFRGDTGNLGQCRQNIREFLGGDASAARKYRIGGLVWGTPVSHSISTGGYRVYVGSTNRLFVCLEMRPKETSVHEVWTFTIPQDRADGLIDSAASLSPDLSQVVVPGGNGTLYALDTSTGALQWEFHADGVTSLEHDAGVIVNSFEGNVRHSKDGKRLIAGCDNTVCYCIDAQTGKAIWEVKTGMMVWTVAALATLPADADAGQHQQDVVFIGSLDRKLYCIDEASGRVLSEFDTGGEVKASPMAFHASNPLRLLVCICNSNGSIQLLSIESRESRESQESSPKVLWKKDVKAEIYGSPALHASASGLYVYVYVCDMEGGITCLSVESGEVIWRVETYRYIASSPLVSQDGVVIVSLSDGKVVALCAMTGNILGMTEVGTGSRRAINASPTIVGTDIIVGSYDGHVHVIPIANLRPVGKDALMYLAPRQHMHQGVEDRSRTHVEVVSVEGSAIISLRLHAYDDAGTYLPRARVDMSTLHVDIRIRHAGTAYEAYKDYEVAVSPDGRFINLLPTRIVENKNNKTVSIRVWGEMRQQQDTWLHDRVSDLLRGVAFECDAVEVVCQTSSSSSFPPSPMSWDVSGMYCLQPTVLETYIPAAMDGQGFVMHTLGHRALNNNNNNEEEDGATHEFIILCLPALPAPEGRPFAPLRDPGKVVVMRARGRGGSFIATVEGTFRFSAMGGTISMSKYVVYGRLMADGFMHLEFYARASCLSIEGNGESYKFSSDILNQMCDARLDVHVIGGASGKPTQMQMQMHQQHMTDQDHLVVWIDQVSGAISKTISKFSSTTTTVSPGCRSMLFVDTNRWEGSHGGGAGLCNVPGRGLISTDGLMLSHVLAKVVQWACSAGVSPNVITLSSVITTVAMVVSHARCVSKTCPGIVLAVPALAMYKWLADVLDGAVARHCKRTSNVGGALDTFADVTFFAAMTLLLLTAAPGPVSERRLHDWHVWAVAITAALLPWIAIAWANGPGSLHDHGEFKNHDSALNTVIWLLSENTLLLIAAFSILYVILAGRGNGIWRRRPSAAVIFTACTFLVAAAMCLVRTRGTVLNPTTNKIVGNTPMPLAARLATATLLVAVPGALTTMAVHCLGEPTAQWMAASLVALILSGTMV